MCSIRVFSMHAVDVQLNVILESTLISIYIYIPGCDVDQMWMGTYKKPGISAQITHTNKVVLSWSVHAYDNIIH